VIARPVCEVRGCDGRLAAQYEYFLVYEDYKGLGAALVFVQVSNVGTKTN
jgi:hypothetical protein